MTRRAIIPARHYPSPVESSYTTGVFAAEILSPMRRRTILTLVIALTAVLVQPDLVGQVPGEEEKALAEIRKRIADLGKQVSEKHAQRQGTTLELRRVERELGAAAQTLVDLQGQLVDQEKRQAELAKEIQVAQGRLATQQASLSQQIRLSYMGGRQEALRLLLNQESPARLGRMMVYYDYLNRARSDRIEQVNGDIRRLEELSAEAREVTAELARLAGRRKEEIARLERARYLAPVSSWK